MAILEKNSNSKVETGDVSTSKKKRKRNKNKKNGGEELSFLTAQQVAEINGSGKEEEVEREIEVKEKKRKKKDKKMKSVEDEIETDENKEEEDEGDDDEGMNIEEDEVKETKKKMKGKSGVDSGIMSGDSFMLLPLSEPTKKAIVDIGFQYMTQVNYTPFYVPLIQLLIRKPKVTMLQTSS